MFKNFNSSDIGPQKFGYHKIFNIFKRKNLKPLFQKKLFKKTQGLDCQYSLREENE